MRLGLFHTPKFAFLSFVEEAVTIASRYDNVKLALEYLLECFEEPYFPRTIQAKNGKQITVNSIDETLSHFERVEWIDCRISLFGTNEIESIRPNSIFMDLDDKESLDYIKIRIFNLIGGRPMVIFTGRGFGLIQPIQIESMRELMHQGLTGECISKEFLRFAKDYLTNKKADPANHPSLKNCLIRVPFTINSKSGLDIELIESWDYRRVSIKNLPFKKHLKEIIQENRRTRPITINPESYSWIENILSHKFNDGFNRVLNFVLARYLMNVKKLSIEESIKIVKKWCDRIDDQTIRYQLNYALKIGKLPTSLSTFKQNNPDISQELDNIPHLTKLNPEIKKISELSLIFQSEQSRFIDYQNTKYEVCEPIDDLTGCYVCNDAKTIHQGKLFDGRIVPYCQSCWIILQVK